MGSYVDLLNYPFNFILGLKNSSLLNQLSFAKFVRSLLLFIGPAPAPACFLIVPSDPSYHSLDCQYLVLPRDQARQKAGLSCSLRSFYRFLRCLL